MTLTRLPSLLADHRKWHDRHQIREFMVRANGATAYGQYKQCVREVTTRWNLLLEESIARVEHQIDVEELEIEIREKQGDTRRLRLKQLRLHVHAESLDAALQDRTRELLELYVVGCALKDEVGDLDREGHEALAQLEWMSRVGDWKERTPVLPAMDAVPEITNQIVSEVLCLAQEAAGVTPDLLPTVVAVE